ncbi:MAG: threonine synthase [bacterium]|nr:threonine synthase [bacterium]
MKKSYLVCTSCKSTYSITRAAPRCDVCAEPLEVRIQYFKSYQPRIKHGNPLTQTILDRYADFFPFTKKIHHTLSLHEGYTPLIEHSELASELRIRRILFKNETQNPTWSFKDRGTVTGLAHAISLGYKRIGTVSTGNMAVSVAAYGAKVGLETIILVSASLPLEKLYPIAIYNPTLIKVKGDYSQLYFASLELGKKKRIYFINSDVPFRVEGSKTIAFELCEQLEFKVPDYVVVPTSSGGNFRGILKGFEEFKQAGFIDTIPIMVCAQAAGCSPIYNAFSAGKETISRIKNPDTLCHAIDNPYPPSGNAVLRKLKEHNGIAVAVSDEEILNAQRTMAQCGIFGQPDSAVPLAAIEKMHREKKLKPSDTIVAIVTGSGLKYSAVLTHHTMNIQSCKLDNLDQFFSRCRYPQMA